MDDRNLTSGNNEDTVVTVSSSAEEQEERAVRCRSRVTRYGNKSLEIEIPSPGVDCSQRLALVLFLSIPYFFVLAEIPLLMTQTLLYGPNHLWFLLFVAVPLLFISGAHSSFKSSKFSQTNVKITRDSYCLIQKNVTWISFLLITWIPDHFDDLEKGIAVETVLEDSQHLRLPSLVAEIMNIADEESMHIKLGFIKLGNDLSNDEVEWLAEEINRFLQETR